MMIASEGPAVDSEVARSAPIIDYHAPEPVPAFTPQSIPGLPPEAQPAPGDVLLSRAFWPWTDLGAEGIPEHWLYMARRVQGVIAQMAVQTSAGPKLVRADSMGRISAGAYYDRNPKSIQLNQYTDALAHGFNQNAIYTVPKGRKAVIESVVLNFMRLTVSTAVGRIFMAATVSVNGAATSWELVSLDNTVGAHGELHVGQAGFLTGTDFIYIADEDDSADGLVHYNESVRLTEFDE